MTNDKHESDETPENDKDDSRNGKEITEKVINKSVLTYIDVCMLSFCFVLFCFV